LWLTSDHTTQTLTRLDLQIAGTESTPADILASLPFTSMYEKTMGVGSHGVSLIIAKLDQITYYHLIPTNTRVKFLFLAPIVSLPVLQIM